MPKPKRTDKKIEVDCWMLANCESSPCEVYFTKKHAIRAKKEWEDNWDEYYKIIKCRITQVVSNKKTK